MTIISGNRARLSATLALAALVTGAAATALAQQKPAVSCPAAQQVPPPSAADGLARAYLFHLRSVGYTQISPNGTRALFTVRSVDSIGMPTTRIWPVNLSKHNT